MPTPPFLPPAGTFDPVPFARPSSLPPPPLPPVVDISPDPPNPDSLMDLSNSTVVVPPPPASIFREEQLDSTAAPHIPEPEAVQPESSREPEDEEGSGREDDDDDDDDDDDGDDEPEFPWHPIEEDRSTPCEDELAYLESKEEHSALDHAYWERETFFDLEDPELVPGASGRIDWLVEHFNGTKEKPNKDLVMKSPVVQIGGYEWQIKFYPKGNRTEFLSVYLECVTMQSDGFRDQLDLRSPPLPVLAGSPRIKKRNSIAAQVSVVMYNPAEPRVYESKVDAHQFHKKSPDFGWKYFTRDPRYDFHVRRHGQRQAILRDDKLAFSAHIRLVDDSTGCMWDQSGPSPEASIATTGLRPFDTSSAQIAAIVPLLHLRPFRDILYKYTTQSASFTALQTFLDKLLARKLKRKHLRSSPLPEGRDIIEVLQILRSKLAEECEPEALTEFDELFTRFEPDQIPICGNRLLLRGYSSVQRAVQQVSTPPVTPPILTVELERQRFDRSKRKWEKLTNRLDISDRIQYGAASYLLYAFVAHGGPLGSSNYTPYVRPGGPGERWYVYEPGQVRCMTQKQAMERYVKSTTPRPKEEASNVDFQAYMRSQAVPSLDRDPVAYLVMYVREDFASYTFALPTEEQWNVPATVKKPHRTPGPKTSNESGGAKPAQDPEKINEIPVSDLSQTRMERSMNEYVPQPAGILPPPDVPRDLMDGDDVVMSDMEEEGSQTPIRVNDAFANTITDLGTGSAQQEPSSEPTGEQLTRMSTVDFFSSEFYRGTVLPSGKFHGSGHLIATNGDEYNGTFVHGFPHGTGTMTYAATGNVYNGEWQAGEHHGTGTYTELSTGNVFEGGWKGGKKHGSFVLRGTVTDEDKGLCQICYEREMNTAFYDCGHVLVCRQCAGQVESCPVCRKRVIARLELYGVKVGLE